VLGVAPPARHAEAHAVPVTMAPEPNARLDTPPSEIVIRFSERVEPRPSTLEVLDARGRRVDAGGAAVEPTDPRRYRVALPPLAPGAYTIAWRVLSADDGHVTHGAYVFTVGNGETSGQSAATVQIGGGWRPLARWLVAMGGALLLGALAAGPLLGLEESRRPAGMEALGGMAMAVGATLDLALQARELAGSRAVTETLVALLPTSSGRVWLARMGLLLGLAAAARAGARRWLRAGLAAAVVTTGCFVSHGAAATESRWLILGVEACHLLAMASWVGGLLGFATVFWRAGERGEPRETPRLALAIPAFSGLAVLAVGTLVVSGLLLARLHIASWGDLVGTPYGRWLAAKLAVFAAMLALGAWHQAGIEPSLVRALADRSPGSSVPRFRRSIRAEAALGLGALALAGTLGVAAPPAPQAAGASESSAGFRHERVFDEARVRLDVTPLHPGPNEIRLVVTDPAGRPLADATAAMVQATPVDASVGAVTFPLDRVGPGEFAAPVAVLGLVGRWSGRLVVQRAGAYDVSDRFDLVVTEATSGHAHGQPADSVRRALPLDRVSGVVAAVTAVITLVLFLRSRRQLRTVRRLLTATPHPPAGAPASR
jgi:copper transport protein